ncbi:holo-ACP synthase [Alteribacillus sp. HJP-4]|uniref:holo-ACP synthase n=1 Tax=Alteribacillus sp. HJP-4 TaxID=2775394 RepID=UPI0035CD09ED
MITGIGMDIIELKRIERIIAKNDKFILRILTPQEREFFSRLGASRKLEYAGGRFAAKEAFAKAYGTGISGRCGFHDIEILTGASGRPYIHAPWLNCSVHVAITHSKDYAAAQVIIEKTE